MERGNVIVIAIVVAAVALFAMRFFSESAEQEQLAALSAADRPAPRRGSGGTGEYGDSDSRGGSRLGGGASSSFGGGGSRPAMRGESGGSNGGGTGGRTGGAASAFGGRPAGGGSVGSSGSSAPGGAGSGATVADIDGVGRVAPKAERQADLVESLSSRPPTKSDLEKPLPRDNGDDVALKLDSTQDIADQDGQAVGEVKDADDGDQGIKVDGENSRVEFPNAGNASKEGSITFTLKPEWAGADATDNALVQIRQEHEWNNRLEIVKNGEFLRFILTDNTGKEADISARITDWPAGQERSIEFSWGNGRTEASIDNQIVGRNEYPGELEFAPSTPMIFGADHPGSTYRPAGATIGNFTVGKTPLFTQ
jgi:hypothetical protein